MTTALREVVIYPNVAADPRQLLAKHDVFAFEHVLPEPRTREPLESIGSHKAKTEADRCDWFDAGTIRRRIEKQLR